MVVAVPLAAAGNVLTVGPGQQYQTIADAVQAAQSGDTIQVQAGTYTNDFITAPNKSLTLQAVGGVVTMVETVSPPSGKAMIVEGGSGVSFTINGFDISGVTVADGNGAAVRYQGGTLTLNDDYFHNNQDGMLADADLSGNILINHSEFAFNGAGDGKTHNLYVNDVGTLTITDSYFHDANVGHEIKSRAENTTITGTRIFDNDSTASYGVDLPNGGNATIQNDTFEKGPNSGNASIISYGEEGSLHSGTTVQIDSSTFVNDRYNANVVNNVANVPITFTNNQLYNIPSDKLGSNVNASNTTYLSSRPTLDTSPVQTVCFAGGTRILTARGEVPVEALCEGEPIVTHGGEQRPLRWLGYRRIDLARHNQPDLVAPVRICRDAIGPGEPRRDLVVSPDHCLFIDRRLIPVKLLINDMTIRQQRGLAAVTYYHVELDRHAVLLAEGLPVESYLDTGNRAFFANAGLALMLHPDFQVNSGLRQWATDACAPLTVSPGCVEPVWRRIAARAEALGHRPPRYDTTADAALRIRAGNRIIRPLAEQDGRHVFALPDGSDSVQLVSRATVPSHTRPWLDEWRRLGVAVRRILVRQSGHAMAIGLDDPSLGAGWHAVERDTATMWRWTDGAAALALPGKPGPAILEIEVGMTLAYPVGTAVSAFAA